METIFKTILESISEDIPKNISNKAYLFIKNNPDKEITKDFVNKLLAEYINIFLDLDLIQSLHISNDLKYEKIQLIYNCLPSRINKNYCVNLFNILEIPSEYYGNLHNFYKGCKWLFNKHGITHLNSIIDELITFTEKNKPILSGGLDNYDSLDIELKRYQDALLGNFNNEDFKTFSMIEKLSNMYLSEYEIQRRYLNKKLGNIGELYCFEFIKNFKHAIFTAKDLGNGFGFDMYFQNEIEGNIIENLVEVKTTTNILNDSFSLSENEYRVICEASQNKNVNYIICRIIYNIEKNEFTCYLLTYENGVFKSINHDIDKIEYIQDETFKLKFNKKEDIIKLEPKKRENI